MGFTVTISPAQKSFTTEDNESILSAALRHGLNMPYGCRSGNCGSCKGRVLSGEYGYSLKEFPALTAEEKANDIILCCQAQAHSDLVIEVELIPTADDVLVRKLPCRVIEKSLLTHDVMMLKLKLPVTEVFQFYPGQYIDILLPDGRRRSFSMANSPDKHEQMIELHIRHIDGGDFTGQVFTGLEEKTVLRIEGPLGHFYLRENTDKPIIFMAGGTGFAPVKSIIEYAFKKGITRNMYLYWGVRAQRDLYFHDLATSWSNQHANFKYIPVLSDPLPEDDKAFRVGYVHEAIMADFRDLTGFEIYASGPPVMVDAGFQAFSEKGVLAENYFSDAFEFQN